MRGVLGTRPKVCRAGFIRDVANSELTAKLEEVVHTQRLDHGDAVVLPLLSRRIGIEGPKEGFLVEAD